MHQGLPPVLDTRTRLLVLGSFPGRRSLETQRYYGHPQNHFWKILAAIWQLPLTDMPYADQIETLHARGLGLWDVYAACEREGSLDSAIRNAQPNDLGGLRALCPQLQAIAHNGGESFRHARHTQALGLPVYRLPSTSPANASWSFERKLCAWREVFLQHAVGGLMAATELPEVNFSEYGDVRYLHLGTEWVQGSMLIDAPFDIELDYVQRMMAWLLFVEPDSVGKRQAMQLGLGAASLTKFCFKKLRMKTTAVELNPQVLAACRTWFKLPPDSARLQVLLADAGQEIQRDAHLGTVDALQVDLYDHEAAAPVLDDEDFYRHCRALLTDDGAMTVNLFGRDTSYEISLQRICAAFGADAVWAFKPTREGNTVVLAQRTPQQPTRMALLARAEAVQSRWGLPAVKWLKLFKPVA